MDDYLLEIDGAVARIVLNRPHVKNTIDPDMLMAMDDDLQKIANNSEIRCVVLSGAGGNFCSGADMNYFQGLFELPEPERAEKLRQGVLTGGHWMETIEAMPQTVVASVRGAVGGSGMAFICAADFVIASENSFFAVAHVKIGGPPDGGATYYLPRLIGIRQAKKLCMLGDRVNAQQAFEIGLVTELVPDSQLEAATEALSARLASSATRALAGAKSLINNAFNNDLPAHLGLEAACFGDAARTIDFIEGVTAFKEKRRPNFVGH
jgi:2-(1,2-epoxy-1,2-dihydrophenyl)acetyl-CoA isomerase